LHGRALARNGAVTLDTDTINRADCAPGTPGATPSPGAPGVLPGGTSPAGGTPPTGAAFLTTSPRKVARTITRFGTRRCVAKGFRARVTGVSIRRVIFLLDGHSIGTVGVAPFQIVVRGNRGIHRLSARVSFTDGSRMRNISFRFRTCAPAARRVARPPRFTG